MLLQALALLCTALPTQTPGEPAPRDAEQPRIEHVVLISMDVTRRDSLGLYGGRAVTPRLDRLAAQGVVLESAFAPTPVTLPSHASLFTGNYPARHGVRDNGAFRLDPAAVTLAERLSAAGFRTAAFVSAFVLDGQFGLAQGFEHYDDRFQSGLGGVLGQEERSATATTDAALAWLEDHGEGPLFLFVHYFDAHHPYQPPEPFASVAAHPYLGEIAYVDSEIGRLVDGLDARGLLESTLLVVVGDHGESLGEHGEETHGIFIYQSTMAVPLLLRGPGLEAGRRVAAAVSLVDVAPTVLAALGLPTLGEAQARSLWPALTTDAELDGRPVYLEARSGLHSFGWAPLAGIVHGGMKYIHAPRPELFDLVADPGERENLVAARPEQAAELRAQLETWLADHGELPAAPGEAGLSDEDRARLESLGYTTSPPAAERLGKPGRDPKDALAEFARLQRAGAAQEEGLLEEALELYDSVLALNPYNYTALERSGMALSNLGRYGEAIPRLERSNLFPGLPMFTLAQAHARVGNIERALTILAEVRQRNPKFMPAHLFFAQYHELQGEHQAAIDAYRALLANWFGDPAFGAQIEAKISKLEDQLK